MTAIQRVESSPMAPYMGLVRGMSREDKLALVAFITETLREPAKQEVKTEEIPVVKKRRKIRKLSPEVEYLSSLNLREFTEEELDADPRLKAIMTDGRR